jgi:hypothetical protein
MAKDVYSFDSYRDFLKYTLSQRKKANSKHSFAWFAGRIGVQRSYLSRVLNRFAALNSDQLYLGCRALHFSAEERDFLFLLLELERSAVEDRKQELIAERNRIQAKHNKAEGHLKKRKMVSVRNDDVSEYYLQPLCPLVHMYLTIPRYLAQPTLLREVLGLNAKSLAHVLSVLETCGILRVDGDRYILLETKLHTSNSTLSRAFSTQFRVKAIEAQQKIGNDEDYFFTSSFTATPEVRDEIRKKFLNFLAWVSDRVEDSEPEEVFCFNFDLFKA